MTNKIKQQLFRGWHSMRWLALGLGCFIGYQAVMYQDIISGLLAVFFLYQAATNKGCLVGICPPNSSTADESSDIENKEYSNIEFTEVEN